MRPGTNGVVELRGGEHFWSIEDGAGLGDDIQSCARYGMCSLMMIHICTR